jgi:hypothetical protein
MLDGFSGTQDYNLRDAYHAKHTSSTVAMSN